MRLDYTNATAAALWVLAMCAVGVVGGVTSLTGWTVLAGLGLLPPFVIARWWKDAPTVVRTFERGTPRGSSPAGLHRPVRF